MSEFNSLTELRKAFPDARSWEFKAYKKHPQIYLAWKKSVLHKGEHQEKQFMKFYHDHVDIHPDNPEIWVQWRKVHPLENRPHNLKDEQSLHEFTQVYKLGEKDKKEHPTVYQEFVKANPDKAKNLAAFHNFYKLYKVNQAYEIDKFFENLDMSGKIDNINDFRKRYPNAADWEFKAYMKDPERYSKWKAENPNGSREQYKRFKEGLSKNDVMKAMIANNLPNLASRVSTVKNYNTFEEFASEFQGAKPWEFKAYQKHPRMFLAWKAENPIQHQKKDYQAFARAHGSDIKEDEPVDDDSQLILDKEGRQSIRDSQAAFRRNALRLRNRYFTSSEPEPPQSITSTTRPKLNLTHIQQTTPPVSIPPSENTRKATLSLSAPIYKQRIGDNKLDLSLGRIEGLEADDRIWNSEKTMYLQTMDRLDDDIKLLPKRNHEIHATNDVRAAIQKLKHGKAIEKRLTSWS